VGAVADGATERDADVIDAESEPALVVRADPRLIRDRRPVAAIVRQRNEETLLALSAGGPLPHVVHAAPPFTRSDTPIRAPRRATDSRPGTPPRNRTPDRSPPAC